MAMMMAPEMGITVFPAEDTIATSPLPAANTVYCSNKNAHSHAYYTNLQFVSLSDDVATFNFDYKVYSESILENDERKCAYLNEATGVTASFKITGSGAFATGWDVPGYTKNVFYNAVTTFFGGRANATADKVGIDLSSLHGWYDLSKGKCDDYTHTLK